MFIKLNPINYRGKTVLMLEIESGEEPCWYDNEMYIRDGGQCKKINGADVAHVYSRFK